MVAEAAARARAPASRTDKVTAYCPRCGTALSDAEVAHGLPARRRPERVSSGSRSWTATSPPVIGASLVVWTTTPWTLPSNDGRRGRRRRRRTSVVERDGERLIVAVPLARPCSGDGWTPRSRRFTGSTLVGARYEPPYPNVEGAHTGGRGGLRLDGGRHRHRAHRARRSAPTTSRVGRAQGWPVLQARSTTTGTFTDDAPAFVRGPVREGRRPGDHRGPRARGVLLSRGGRTSTPTRSAGGAARRCSTSRAPSWYVRTTAVKERLLEVNDAVNWFPDHIKHGRYGNWLENNVDWALSRERYWGTPLPIWRCAAGHETAIGSLTELGELAGRDVSDVDPHRPAIDEVTFPCPECGEHRDARPRGDRHLVRLRRDAVRAVGLSPRARPRARSCSPSAFPADFISEAIDQTRGWFYTLMAEGVLQFDSTAYRNVVCLGHLVAADGRKMSKSLGNALDPWEALDRQGADALALVHDHERLAVGVAPDRARGARRDRAPVPAHALERLRVLRDVRERERVRSPTRRAADADRPDRPLGRCRSSPRRSASRATDWRGTTPPAAGRRIQTFLDDLSNWYVRRSRRRFWNPGARRGRRRRAQPSPRCTCAS